MYPMVPRCIRIMTLFVSCPLPTIKSPACRYLE